jgi:hypothetical protein
MNKNTADAIIMVLGHYNTGFSTIPTASELNKGASLSVASAMLQTAAGIAQMLFEHIPSPLAPGLAGTGLVIDGSKLWDSYIH